MEPGPDRPEPPPCGPFTAVDAWFVPLIYVCAAAASAITGLVGYAVSGEEVDPVGPVTLAASAVGLYGGFAFGCRLVARARGTGSLPDDLGFVVRLRDWAAIPAGVGIAIAAGLILSPISNLVDENQDVVDELNNATGAKLVVFALIAGLAAPVFEELLFRGLLLRSLLAKFSPLVAIAISATAFGTVHLLDFSLGTVVVLPALIAFGAISAHQAVKTGDLSRSILLHVGFNLPAVIGALF